MAFKFPLEALLKKNKYEEELAKKDFAMSQGRLNETLETIQNFQTDIVNSRAEMADLRRAGGSVHGGLDYRASFIDGLKVKISRLQEVAREQMVEVEEKKSIMVEAMKEHKKLCVLRDKRLKEYKVARKKKEEKILDDILIMRHKAN